MTRFNNFIKNASIVLAVLGLVSFIYNVVLFVNLQPRMIVFDTLDPFEENLFLGIGAGLLVYLGFCVSALLHIANYLRKAPEVKFRYIVLVVGIILSLLFVFSDFALMSDVVKQYRMGLSQPEWPLVYVLMGFQAIVLFSYLIFQWVYLSKEVLLQEVVLDSNIYMIAQYIGVVCGFMGLSFSTLGFYFSTGWNLTVHTTVTMIILLIPYGLAVGYWLLTKMQEKKTRLYDEKQLQDIGKSSFITLVVSLVVMICLFVVNYNNLRGILSMLWLPILVYCVLFLFSLGNIYFGWKE
jgi:hypothetical protein